MFFFLIYFSTDAGGLFALGPATAIDEDPSNPLGPYNPPTNQPQCQPTSEFSNGLTSAKIVMECHEGMMVGEASISKVEMIGCDYTITFITGGALKCFFSKFEKFLVYTDASSIKIDCTL
mgnify:CR=1 FL=1